VSLHVLVSDYLLVAPHLLLVGVLILLVQKGLRRLFPLFFAYTLWELGQFTVALVMLLSPAVTGKQYGIAYSIGLAISTILRFGVIHEIFAHAFGRYHAVSSYGKPAFRWITVGLLALTLSLALYTGGNHFDGVMVLVHLLDRAAAITQCGLLLALFAFASYLGLSLRSHVFGIALGLGVFATVELATAALRSQLGYVGNTTLNYITMATYHVCVVIWLVYLWAPERSTQYAVKGIPEHELEAWNKELQRLIQR